MGDQRNEKKSCFFETELRRGIKICRLQEKGFFFNSIREHLGIIFPTPNSSVPQNVPQKSCLGVKWGAKLCKKKKKILFRVFSSKGQISIRVCFENLWHVYNTSIRVPPPTQQEILVMYRTKINDVSFRVLSRCSIGRTIQTSLM